MPLGLFKMNNSYIESKREQYVFNNNTKNNKAKKISLIHKEHIFLHDKQTSTNQGVPPNTLLSGSLTVEASLVFPLFLFLMVAILFFFRVLQVETIAQGALAQTAGYVALDEDVTLAKAKGIFYAELSKQKFPFSYLSSGKAGIRWNGTDVKSDYVELQIQYTCKMPVSLPGLKKIPIRQSIIMKKWTGFQGNAGQTEEEEWVYITPTQSVYHKTNECTHLCLSIQKMERRRTEKAGYKACALCAKDGSEAAYYYVTDEGEKYHTKLTCSGLKRTVYMVRMSEVKGKGACSRCGGR